MYELDLNLLQREAKLAVNYRSMPLIFQLHYEGIASDCFAHWQIKCGNKQGGDKQCEQYISNNAMHLKQFKLTFRQAKLFKMHCFATIITALCVISGL